MNTPTTTAGSALFASVRGRRLKELQSLLDGGADRDARESPGGLTPLMAAAGLGWDEGVKALIEAGADVWVVDGRAGASALHKACQIGSLEAAKALVEAGALVNQPTSGTGHTPLIEAMWFKAVEVVEYLLEHGAGLEVRTLYGFTLADHLNYALKVTTRGRERLMKIQELVERRRQADRAALERQKLMAAVVAGDLAKVKEQIAGGAKLDERAPILNGFNDGHTPLLVAAREGHLEIVRELVRAGADVNAVEPTFGAVPLHKATYNGHAEITALLADSPRIDLDYQGPSNGYTPLHDALWHGYGDCARILVEAGARLDLRGHDGLSPLELAEKVLGPGDPVTELIRTRRR